MARSYPNGYLSMIREHGLAYPVPRMLRWPATAARRVRTAVLPDLDIAPPASSDVAVAASGHSQVASTMRRVVPAVMVMLLLLVIGLVTFRAVYAHRVYPAVVVGDVSVGGLTIDQAEARLIERASMLERGTVAFSHEGHTWTPTLRELGVTVKLDESIAHARQLGRGENATTRLAFIGSILHTDQVVPLQTQVDQAALNAWFDRVDRELGLLPVDARLDVDGATVTVVPGRIGTVVDWEPATAHLLGALSSLEPVMVALPTRSAVPEITAEALAPLRSDVAAFVSKPVTATFEDRTWPIEADSVVPHLVIEIRMESGAPTAHLSVDTKGLARELRSVYSPEISRMPVDAVLGWDDGLVVVEPAVSGAALRADAFAEAVAGSFLSGHGSVEVPVVSTAPEIDDSRLATYGITELLGSGHSNFEGGNWERDENIRVGSSLLNSTLVPPGGTFSFNGAIGEITSDKGYQEAMVVVADQVGRNVGGGVCQVSTTVFRAAINAGMPIMEWYPHTFRLPNYERDGWGPGFDASILQLGPNPETWPDFRFENYTDSWLLIESTVTETHNYVNIYGTGDGRTVDVDSWAIGGNAFGFTRLIHDAKGEIIADRTFESHYK